MNSNGKIFMISNNKTYFIIYWLLSKSLMSIITYIGIILFRRISNSYDIYIYIRYIINSILIMWSNTWLVSILFVQLQTKIYFFNNIVNIMCQHEKTITLKKNRSMINLKEIYHRKFIVNITYNYLTHKNEL